MTQILEVWANTGEIVERDFTPEELVQREADLAAAAEAAAEADAVVAQREALRASAEKKLAKLGLTVDEIAAITP
jgi:hypothetical protein